MTSSFSYTSHRFLSSCGRLNLHARIYPGAGPTLLLMHGLTRNSADFEPLAAQLAATHRLVVPDQRGRGLSEWDENPANYRADVYAADMFTLLDGLGIGSAGLIGTSMGGLVAMLMGVLQPQRVSAIVLNDIGPSVEAAGLARVQSYVGAKLQFSGWHEAAERCAAINGSAFPDYAAADWAAFARRTCLETADGAVSFAYDPAISLAQPAQEGSAPLNAWPVWDLLDDMPVLVIRGERSDVLSVATMDEMACRHTGPLMRVSVPGRGHAPMLDEPQAVMALESFLNRYGLCGATANRDPGCSEATP